MSERVKAVVGNRLFWPVLALVLLLVSNLFFSRDFFSLEVRDGHLYGSIIDILRNGAPLILVATGMTVVIATGGIDLSVGAIVAIVGGLACYHISTQPDQNSLSGVITAVLMGIGLALVLGLWNGILVAGIGIQPIIATLILMVAGRGLAQMITDDQIITIRSPNYKFIGAGHLFTVPFAILVALLVVLLAVLLTRRTALGMLLESVGGNAEASRLAGIRARRITIMVYVFCGLCAGIAGLMISADVSSADGTRAGLWIELDAILAVVIGGTSLLGGRFSIAGTVLGALIIQTLTTTILTIGVPSDATLLFKALVVTIVCLLQSPQFRAKFIRRRRPPVPPPATPAETPKVEVPA
ncbi:ABC transporter permease [Luedemannella flava]|uniref:ABC transporter permease n=1 Tax=Luedemannella flava TaxID=349316 RepID=A0ABN2M107_9ACTN